MAGKVLAFPSDVTDEAGMAAAVAAIEAQVAECPSQYLWSYHRHKVRRRAKPLEGYATLAQMPVVMH